MAGHPVKRAMLAAIADKGGVEWVYAQVANGRTMWSIARELETSRNVLADWLNVDAERKAMYHAARAASAAALAEESMEIADKASELGTSKARLQMESRQWLAGVYNREEFGVKQTAVQVNIGALHIDAMRQFNASNPSTQVIDTKALPE